MIQRFFPLWVFSVLILMAVGTVWLRLAVVRTTYEINQLDKMIRNSSQERERLELKTAQLRSPRRLELLARKKFNLFPPKTNQVVHFRGKQIQ